MMMEMINRCLEITHAKRDEIEIFDRAQKRKEMIAMRKERARSPEFGNRKERRRQRAIERQSSDHQ
jgi:hypothetical protein